MTDKVIKTAKIILWLFPVFVLLWLFNQNFTPMGKLSVWCDADKCSKLAVSFATKEPDKIIGEIKEGDRYRQIAHDPIYFTVKTPRPFAKAKIRAEFANSDSQSVFNFGALASNGAYVFKNVFSQNSLIEQLEKDWETIKESDSYLFTRPPNDENSDKDKELRIKNDESAGDSNNTESVDRKPAKKFLSIDEFINNLPPFEEIRAHNYDLSNHIKLKDYKPSDKRLEINNTLRGPHEIITYIENEPLDFKFSFQDINRHKGKDNFSITVSRFGKKVLEKKVSDDGISKATGIVKDWQDIDIYLEKPLAGVYVISVQAKDDDVFIRKISTRQNLLIFSNHIYLADNDEYKILDGVETKPADLFAVGSKISVRTSHKQNTQTVKVDKKSIILKETDKEYELNRTTGASIALINAPKNDIYLSTDGFFAFDSRQIFNPDLGAVLNLGEAVPESINYVVAKYPKLTDLGGGWFEAKAEFSGKELYRDEKGQYNFILQIPGLPENKRVLKLRKIEVEFEKEPITIFNLWTKIKNKLKI